jgi:hypothetical protein
MQTLALLLTSYHPTLDCDVHLPVLGVERDFWEKLYRAFHLANPEQVVQ